MSTAEEAVSDDEPNQDHGRSRGRGPRTGRHRRGDRRRPEQSHSARTAEQFRPGRRNAKHPCAQGPRTRHQHDGHKGKGLLGKVEHGEFTTHTKTGDKVLDVQRGTVTDVNDKSITVTSTDGFSATYKIDATSTKVRKDKKEVPVSQIAKNDRVQLTAVKAGDTTTAQHIGDSGLAK